MTTVKSQTSAPDPWTGFKAGSAAAAPPRPEPEPAMARIPLVEVHESPANPRTHFDQVLLEELAKSLAATGQLTPCLVRPRAKGGYELAAGHRRFRAAKMAGLPTLLCLVRDLDDKQFVEVLTIENLQRDDLHPLEEAKGYASLMTKAIGYDVAKIAERVGRSVKYVYDRVKLLQLTKEAQQLFLEDRFSAGHAILLARLSPADQARAIASERSGNGQVGGLFVFESGLFDLNDDDETRQKPASVREFQAWIDQNVRLVEEAVDLPNLFPETFAVLAAAEQAEEKVIHITHNHQLRPEVRAEGERTWGPVSWKRADGKADVYRYEKKPSKACDHAVLGVIVVGPGRGEAFKVCIEKKKCRIHWPAAKAVEPGGMHDTAYEERQRKETERWERQQAERRVLEARIKKALPAIMAAVTERVKKLPATVKGPLAPIVLGAANMPRVKPTGTSAEDLVRFIALRSLLDDASNTYRMVDFTKQAKALGVDIGKILDKEAPKEKVAAAVAKASKTDASAHGVAHLDDDNYEDPDA